MKPGDKAVVRYNDTNPCPGKRNSQNSTAIGTTVILEEDYSRHSGNPSWLCRGVDSIINMGWFYEHELEEYKPLITQIEVEDEIEKLEAKLKEKRETLKFMTENKVKELSPNFDLNKVI